MNTEMKNALTAAKYKSQYDYYAKRLLANKWVLAHILRKTVSDFEGMDPEAVVGCIESEPVISRVPTEQGLMNAEHMQVGGSRIIGLNTESAEINEGMICYDIICYVRTPDGISRVIINVEAQKEVPGKYPILNRAVFYGARMISSQKERDFEHSDYGEIKRIYSIWICMNMSECMMNHIHLTDDKLIGEQNWPGDINLFNIIFIGLPRKLPERNVTYDLHRLLTALLTADIAVDDKMKIIKEEYRIPVESDLGKDVNIMCNLSEGIWEKALEQGIEQGMEQLIVEMYEDGISIEQIARISKLEIEEVRRRIERLLNERKGIQRKKL